MRAQKRCRNDEASAIVIERREDGGLGGCLLNSWQLGPIGGGPYHVDDGCWLGGRIELGNRPELSFRAAASLPGSQTTAAGVYLRRDEGPACCSSGARKCRGRGDALARTMFRPGPLISTGTSLGCGTKGCWLGVLSVSRADLANGDVTRLGRELCVVRVSRQSCRQKGSSCQGKHGKGGVTHSFWRRGAPELLQSTGEGRFWVGKSVVPPNFSLCGS